MGLEDILETLSLPIKGAGRAVKFGVKTLAFPWAVYTDWKRSDPRHGLLVRAQTLCALLAPALLTAIHPNPSYEFEPLFLLYLHTWFGIEMERGREKLSFDVEVTKKKDEFLHFIGSNNVAMSAILSSAFFGAHPNFRVALLEKAGFVVPIFTYITMAAQLIDPLARRGLLGAFQAPSEYRAQEFDFEGDFQNSKNPVLQCMMHQSVYNNSKRFSSLVDAVRACKPLFDHEDRIFGNGLWVGMVDRLFQKNFARLAGNHSALFFHYLREGNKQKAITHVSKMNLSKISKKFLISEMNGDGHKELIEDVIENGIKFKKSKSYNDVSFIRVIDESDFGKEYVFAFKKNDTDSSNIRREIEVTRALNKLQIPRVKFPTVISLTPVIKEREVIADGVFLYQTGTSFKDVDQKDLVDFLPILKSVHDSGGFDSDVILRMNYGHYFLKKIAQRVPELWQKFSHYYNSALDLLTCRNRTDLCHGDLRRDQLIYSSDRKYVMILDNADVYFGDGLLDLAELEMDMGFSADVSLRRMTLDKYGDEILPDYIFLLPLTALRLFARAVTHPTASPKKCKQDLESTLDLMSYFPEYESWRDDFKSEFDNYCRAKGIH